MDRYADDVVAVLDALQIEKAVVVGLSMGGYVALAAAMITYGMDRHLVAKVAAISVPINVVFGLAAASPSVFILESSRAEAMCLRHVDGSFVLVTKPARERNHPA